MLVPLTLRRRSTAVPPDAVFVPTSALGTLTHWLAGLTPVPPIYAVPVGYLVVGTGPVRSPIGATIALRAVGEQLFVPADAEVVPALHPAELRELTASESWLLLPGGAWAFDPHQPVALATLIAIPRRPARTWRPLPTRPARAELLGRIERQADMNAEALLNEGAPPDLAPTEDLPTPSSGTGQSLLGRAGISLGQSAKWLGDKLGLSGLSAWGQQMIAQALTRAPQLTASVLGQQAAALRELLRRFQAGDIETALRHAMPLGGASDDAPGTPHEGTELPNYAPVYALGDLLSGGGRGPASVWHSEADVHNALRRAYTETAEQALHRGDFRRAAYIFGRLLRDFRRAADALSRGGMHHDAAILYRDKLSDAIAAARSFAAAGEFDTAIALFRREHCHEDAGDLLYRCGRIEEAHAEYHLAAVRLAERGQHLAAGEFVEKKLDSAAAEPYYRAGWAGRLERVPPSMAVPCGLRLVRLYGDADAPSKLLTLLSEGEAYWAEVGQPTTAGQFFNLCVAVVQRPHLASVRAEVTDRALVQLAQQLRSYAAVERRPGQVVSTLFGGGNWTPAQTSDAAYTLRQQQKWLNRPDSAPTVQWERVATAQVTLATVASATGQIILATANGQVLIYTPNTTTWGSDTPGGLVQSVLAGENPVVLWSLARVPTPGLSVLPGGQAGAIALNSSWRGFFRTPTSEYRPGATWVIPRYWVPSPTGLLSAGEAFYGLDFEPGLAPPWLVGPERRCALSGLPGVDAFTRLPTSAVLLPGPAQYSALVWLDSDFYHTPLWLQEPRPVRHASVRWQPGIPDGSGLYQPPVAWHHAEASDHYEVAGVTAGGQVYWSQLTVEEHAVQVQRTCARHCTEGFRAVAILKPGVVVAVSSKNLVYWLRAGATGGEFTLHPAPIALNSPTKPLAVYALPNTGEVFVLMQDGTAARVRVPM
jgi:tetratricopeptide (TPR) repeat protein